MRLDVKQGFYVLVSKFNRHEKREHRWRSASSSSSTRLKQILSRWPQAERGGMCRTPPATSTTIRPCKPVLVKMFLFFS